MRCANYRTAVVIVTAITASLLIGGCIRNSPQESVGAKPSMGMSVVVGEALPEVVVTAQRPQTVALSRRDTNAATELAASRTGHR
jgi:hypothetical protein